MCDWIIFNLNAQFRNQWPDQWDETNFKMQKVQFDLPYGSTLFVLESKKKVYYVKT